MATLVGTAHIYSLSGATLGPVTNLSGLTSFSGWISPNVQGITLRHTAADHREIKSMAGITTGKIFVGEDILECEFNFIPEGTTIANAKISAWLAGQGAYFTISGLPIIVVGSFADAYNTGGSSTQPWFYEGGGTLNGTNTSEWSSTMTLRRYSSITSGAAITS